MENRRFLIWWVTATFTRILTNARETDLFRPAFELEDTFVNLCVRLLSSTAPFCRGGPSLSRVTRFVLSVSGNFARATRCASSLKRRHCLSGGRRAPESRDRQRRRNMQIAISRDTRDEGHHRTPVLRSSANSVCSDYGDNREFVFLLCWHR